MMYCNLSFYPFASESCMALTQLPVAVAKFIVAQIHPHKDNEPKCQVSTGFEIH